MYDARAVSFGQRFSNVLQVTQQLREVSLVNVNTIAESSAVDKTRQ